MGVPWRDYVATRLDTDVTRWLEHFELAVKDARSVTPFLSELEPEAARSLREWDRRARAGKLPVLVGLESDQYGQDLADDGIDVLDADENVAAQVWPLGHDGGGNLYLVLRSGQVKTWEHEESRLGHISFPSLDAFAWAFVLVSAAREGKVPLEEAALELANHEESGFRYLAQRLREQ